MAAGKMTPRQKMINMMYLVLTALLALNVSKEVLNSFFEVNLGIVKTTDGLDKKNTETYAAFEDATNQEKVKNYKNLANEIKPQALELVNFIQEMKYNLVLKVDNEVYLGEYKDEDGEEIEDNRFEVAYDKLDSINKIKRIAWLSKKDDRNSSGDIFNPQNKPNLPRIDGEGKATQLKNNILDYKEFLLNILETAKDSNWVSNNGKLSSLIEEINTTLDIKTGKDYGEKGKKVSWEHYNFHDMPSVGSLTLLSKWQADVKNMELAVISFLASNVNESFLKFSGAEATTIPEATVVLKGDEFKSKIYLAAFDKSSSPEVFIGDYELDENGYPVLVDNEPKWIKGPEIVPVEDGQGIYTVKSNRVGPKEYKGLIKILQDEGYQYYPFQGEYIVANKSYTISPTKMNVVYIGLDNPISVSVAGYQPDQLSVSCIGCKEGGFKTVSKKEGTYTVDPDKTKYQKKITISIKVKGTDKTKAQSFEPMEFRVMKVPSPDLKLGSIKKRASVEEIIGSSLSARLNNFPFEGLGFRIKKFTVTCTGEQEKNYECKGNELSAPAIKNIRRLPTGGSVTISDVWVYRKGQVPEVVDQFQKKVYIK